MQKVTILLNSGKTIHIGLDAENAPKTCENFIKLVKEGFYEGLCFHRVIPNFMIQGGGFSIKDGQLVNKNAGAISGEFLSNKHNNGLSHTAGVISMARTSDKNSASSQFFICASDCTYLDGEYAAFGKVLDEQSLVNAQEISKVKTGRWMAYDDVPVDPVIIQKITVEE